MKSSFTKLRLLAFITMIALFAAMQLKAQNQTTIGMPHDGEWQNGPNVNWFIHWNYALAEARTKDKAIFILSTGSDWCGWCIRLRKNVLDQQEFLDYANKNLVLLYLDSPKKNKLCPEQEQHNAFIRKSLGVGGGVPNVIIVSHQGKLLGKISGGGLKLNEYLDKLNGILNGSSDAILPARGQALFTKGYLKEANSSKPASQEASAAQNEAQQDAALKEQFKAKIIGVAVADKASKDNEDSLEYHPIDTPVKVPRGMRVYFKVQYDFPDGYAASIWTRPVVNYPGMGSNPSGYYKGKGIQYGFLTHPASNEHMTQVMIRTNSSPRIGDEKEWIIITQDVNIDFE